MERPFPLPETAARGLEGWTRWMAADVLRPDFHGPASGQCLTIWRRDPDGGRVLVEAGVNDPPPQGTPD